MIYTWWMFYLDFLWVAIVYFEKSLTSLVYCWILTQCMRSENSVLAYLATVAVRGTIKFAAEHGSLEIGVATRVSYAWSCFHFLRIHNTVLFQMLNKAISFVLHALRMRSNHLVCCIFCHLQQEYANRLAVLTSDHLLQLVKLLCNHSLTKTSALEVRWTPVIVLRKFGGQSLLWLSEWACLAELS